MEYLELRQSLIDTVRQFNPLGINQGTSGNASVRVEEGFLVTASGLPYESLTPEDIVRVDFDGDFSSPHGGRKPSSEWRFHRDILATRPDINAIVHTHGRSAAALSALRRDLPPFHYMIALAGGSSIRCADYATFGEQALSDRALEALEGGRRACLLANHGLIACGADLKKALALAVEVEALCAMYLTACAVGEPVLLTEEQMQEAKAKFEKGYGSGQGFKDEA